MMLDFARRYRLSVNFTEVIGPLKYRDFQLLWVGLVLHAIASWVHQVASSWLILELTGSPLMLGLNGFFGSVPFLLASIYAGALADRMDRRKLLVISQLLSTIIAPILAFLTAFSLVEVWHIYLITLLGWTIRAFDPPARQALIPSLVPRNQLMRAIALTSLVRRSTALVGPIIGGIAVSNFGVSGAFFIHVFLNAMVLVALLSMRVASVRMRRLMNSMGGAILDGLMLLRRHKLIFGLLSLEAVDAFFVSYRELMPVFARDIHELGPTGLGILYSSQGVGVVCGSVLLLVLGEISKKGQALLLTAVLESFAVLLFALSPSAVTAMLTLVTASAIDMIGGVVRNSILQISVDDEMRGRIMAMSSAINRGLGPVGGLQSGALATLIGAPFAICTGASINIAYTTILFIRTPCLYLHTDEQRVTLSGTSDK